MLRDEFLLLNAEKAWLELIAIGNLYFQIYTNRDSESDSNNETALIPDNKL